jgi:sugar-specific transcriptional regulator TrmB
MTFFGIQNSCFHVSAKKPINSSSRVCLGRNELSHNDTEALIELGLTKRQAKVYLALLRIGPSKAEAISTAASVHRPEVYRVVDRLQEIGLAKKHLSTPTIFSAVSINEAIKLMISRKTIELKKTCKKAKSLIHRLDKINRPANRKLAESPILVISENEYLKKMRCGIAKSRCSIDVIAPSVTLRSWFFLFDGLLEKTLQRNVAFRVITEEHENKLLPKNLIPFSESSFGFELRTVPEAPLASVVIFDNIEVTAIINMTDSLIRKMHLWSSNESLLALCQGYFNSLWLKARHLNTPFLSSQC